MKKLLILFIISLLMVSYSYGLGAVPGDMPYMLVYDNGHGIVNLLNSLGYAESGMLGGGDYVLWSSLDDTATGSDFDQAGYKVIITGWAGGYTGLQTNITTNPGNNYTTVLTGRKVISGQDPDAHNKASVLGNMINWILEGYDSEGMGYIHLADTVDQFDWLPWFSSTDAKNDNGDDVNIVSGFENHALLTGLTEADLSNWGSSYHVTFDTIPDDWAAITETNAGEGITLITGDGIGGSVPEPTTIGLLLIGIIGIFRIYKK